VYAEIPRPVTIQSELNELFNGPGSAQAGAPGNLLTYIPAGTSVISATVTPTGLATLDLSPDIENAIGEELIQAFAQMVYTITWPTACHKIDTGPLPRTTPPPPRGFETPCVDKVVFEVDGVPQQVPIADGAQTNQPTTRADYKSLL
jgi:spore germination protein GerM